MAFTSLTSAQCDADSPIDETLMQLIRTNLDDLDSRVSATESISNSDIRDDFISEDTVADPALWDAGSAGAGGVAPAIIAEHTMNLTTLNNAAASSSAIGADDAKMRVDITEEYVVVLKFRIKNSGTVNIEQMRIGLQDIAMDEATTAGALDVTDFIGVVLGTAGGWSIYVDNAGGGPSRIDDQGTQGSWTTFEIHVTCSATAGNRKVEAWTDGVSAGSAITTNIPTVSLRPFAAVWKNTAAVMDMRIDYFLAHFSGRPTAA